MTPDRLVTLATLAARFPLFPAATVRGWMNRNERGFRDRCVIQAGGKVLVDLDAFSVWLEDGRGLVNRREVIVSEGTQRGRKPRLSFDEMMAAARNQTSG